MLTIGKLTQKGFERIVYDNQIDKPVFYGRRFENIEDVIKIHQHLGESTGEHDFDYSGLYCHIEISEDLSIGQYLFSEIKIDSGYVAHDLLSVEEFEKLLKVI